MNIVRNIEIALPVILTFIVVYAGYPLLLWGAMLFTQFLFVLHEDRINTH